MPKDGHGGAVARFLRLALDLLTGGLKFLALCGCCLWAYRIRLLSVQKFGALALLSGHGVQRCRLLDPRVRSVASGLGAACVQTVDRRHRS